MFDRKAYYEQNKEHLKAESKRWRNANRSKRSKYYKDHEEKLRARDPRHLLVRGARVRAKRKGLECTITKEDIVIPSHCPVLGMELKRSAGARRDNSITIDRIDPKQGYTKDNIVVISWRANRIKSDASLDEMERIVEFYKNYNM